MNPRIPDSIREEITNAARAGTIDATIARRFSIHASTVKRIRLSAGVGAPARKAEVTAAMMAELPHVSDRAMERKYGMTHQNWSRIRAREGIPRFRPPTTGKDAPPPREKPKRPIGRESGIPYGLQIARPRECTVVTEAADYLRRERWVVVNRSKVYGKDGWDVGRMCMSEAELIEMAVRRGFKVEGWMG